MVYTKLARKGTEMSYRRDNTADNSDDVETPLLIAPFYTNGFFEDAGEDYNVGGGRKGDGGGRRPLSDRRSRCAKDSSSGWRWSSRREPKNASCNCLCIVCADDGVRVIVQNMGEAEEETRGAGLHLLKWPFQTASLVSLKIRHIDIQTNTKTIDNVSVSVHRFVFPQPTTESPDPQEHFQPCSRLIST